MFALGSISFLVTASLTLALIHFAWSAFIHSMVQREISRLFLARGKLNLARQNQLDIDQRVIRASSELDSVNYKIFQLERHLDEKFEENLRFEIVIGRPGNNLSQYTGTVSTAAKRPKGRDQFVWYHPVTVMMWAPSPDRARNMLMESYPKSQGFQSSYYGAVTVDDAQADTHDQDLGDPNSNPNEPPDESDSTALIRASA
jgi:hypothetical protein